MQDFPEYASGFATLVAWHRAGMAEVGIRAYQARDDAGIIAVRCAFAGYGAGSGPYAPVYAARQAARGYRRGGGWR